MKAENTKRKMKNSFLDLAKVTAVNKISITNVVAHAKVSRGTFYTHYENMQKMVEDIGHDLLKDMDLLFQACPPYDPMRRDYSVSQQIANYIQTHQSIFLLLLGTYGDPCFLNKWTEQFRNFLLKRLREEDVYISPETERIVNFLSVSGIRMIRESFQDSLISVTVNTLYVIDSILHALAVSQKYLPGPDSVMEMLSYLY
ncbi:MAG: TetR/AcrR family transcriptional regulator [Clostridiales bacterium]|nr:TetR/AcrR family transcriptional regulator [Clostridiales bacterium]